jgi:tRNA 2-selenouridine synthase
VPVSLHPDQFLQQALALAKSGKPLPMLDVRSPGEFARGHIPGAQNIPLFDNEGRAEVGTIYKQKGKQPAILRGLELVGPNMATMAERGRLTAIDNTVFVHCWRGGMRSGSVAWLLESYGVKVFTLKGGYKAFRRYMQQQFEAPKNLLVLGGRTGSQKTTWLHALQGDGEQVIDLEGLACHKGSSFGMLGEHPQPTQEQFENL